MGILPDIFDEFLYDEETGEHFDLIQVDEESDDEEPVDEELED